MAIRHRAFIEFLPLTEDEGVFAREAITKLLPPFSMEPGPLFFRNEILPRLGIPHAAPLEITEVNDSALEFVAGHAGMLCAEPPSRICDCCRKIAQDCIQELAWRISPESRVPRAEFIP
jgi:hypothetical protein